MSNLTQRILVALVAIPAFVFLSLQGGLYFFALVLFISLLGLHEYYKLAEKKGAQPNISLGLVFGAFVTSSFIVEKLSFTIATSTQALLSVVLLFVPIVMLVELFRNRGSAVLNTATTLLGVFYVSLFLGSLIGIREAFSNNDAWGGATIITLFVSIWMCDSLAYFAGRFLGKHKLFERVSPKKTWEGAIAGYVGALATFLVARVYFLPYLTIADALACGSIVGIFGQLGDLFESLLKRDAGVKDSSALIPGHGGALDRFDSLIFVSPLLYIYIRLFLA